MYARSYSFHSTRVPCIRIPRYCWGLLGFAEGFINYICWVGCYQAYQVTWKGYQVFFLGGIRWPAVLLFFFFLFFKRRTTGDLLNPSMLPDSPQQVRLSSNLVARRTVSVLFFNVHVYPVSNSVTISIMTPELQILLQRPCPAGYTENGVVIKIHTCQFWDEINNISNSTTLTHLLTSYRC